MSEGTSIDSGMDYDGTEKSPLIITDNGHHSRAVDYIDRDDGDCHEPGRKHSINGITNGRNNSSAAVMNFSITTLIGLMLILAMVSLTVLSICLQRYSTNTYVDIFVPPHNASNNASDATTPGLIL